MKNDISDLKEKIDQEIKEFFEKVDEELEKNVRLFEFIEDTTHKATDLINSHCNESRTDLLSLLINAICQLGVNQGFPRDFINEGIILHYNLFKYMKEKKKV